MPRLATIEHPALRSIAEDQRYAPKNAALRAVERIETLATEIDAQAHYPHEYVVFRVTGYRPAEDTLELVAGSDLLRDLSALCETLCSSAGLTFDAVPDDALIFETLLERWGVSRRTIDRDRRRGLIARRLRDESNADRLVFARTTVEAFERAHPERLPDHAKPPRRLSDDERALIVQRAERYALALDMSRHAIAGRIASRLGRSVNAVRAVIDEHDDGERVTLDARTRRVMLARWERGEPVSSLADRIGRTRTAGHRLLLRERLGRLAGVGDPGPAADQEAEAAALEHPAASSGLEIPTARRPDAALELADALSHAPPEEERAIAHAHRAAWRRCAALVRALEPEAPPARLVDRAETDARWASSLRSRLCWCAFPMVVRTIEERAGARLTALPTGLAMELIESAMRVVVESASRYDPAAGGRLSGRASQSVDRVVVRMLREEETRRSANVASARRVPDPGGWQADAHLAPGVVLTPAWLEPALDRVSPDQRTLLVARFGFDGLRPRTVVELAEDLGVGEQAVWAALREAVRTARGEGVR